jgi:hypothetical protein
MALSLLAKKPEPPAPAPPMFERLQLEAAKRAAEARAEADAAAALQRRTTEEHEARLRRQAEMIAGAQRNWAAYRDALKARRDAAHDALSTKEGEVASRRQAGAPWGR